MAASEKRKDKDPMAEMRRDPMMAHLLDALKDGRDIGHYGRLTFVMVARQFIDSEEIVRLLLHDKDVDQAKARALVQQVEEHDYNPPRRARILEWQAKQEFPIIPDPGDPDAGNVYRDLEMPDEVYENIEAYHEQRVGQHA
jgi:hypothetical protein